MICRYLTQKAESWGKKRKLAGRPFCFSLSKLLLLYSASTSSTSSYHVQDQDRWVKAILCPPSTLLLILHFSIFENRKHSSFSLHFRASMSRVGYLGQGYSVSPFSGEHRRNTIQLLEYSKTSPSSVTSSP